MPEPIHDIDAPAGASCAGCEPAVRPVRRYLVVAARNTYGAGAACGHWHAEHATDSADDARAMLRALADRHGSAELAARDADGRYRTVSSITAGERADRRPCCQPAPAGLTYTAPADGGRCGACGDPWAQWAPVAPVGA